MSVICQGRYCADTYIFKMILEIKGQKMRADPQPEKQIYIKDVYYSEQIPPNFYGLSEIEVFTCYDCTVVANIKSYEVIKPVQ